MSFALKRITKPQEILKFNGWFWFLFCLSWKLIRQSDGLKNKSIQHVHNSRKISLNRIIDNENVVECSTIIPSVWNRVENNILFRSKLASKLTLFIGLFREKRHYFPKRLQWHTGKQKWYKLHLVMKFRADGTQTADEF